mgnify:CR=1 FL=1
MSSSVAIYELTFNIFAEQIRKIKVGSIGHTGIKKIAKAVLLLSVIKGIEDGRFKTNRFSYDDVEEIYKNVFGKYAESAKQTEHTPAYYPFYHLRTSDFWNLEPLVPGHSQMSTNTPSPAWLRGNVAHARLDPALWELLQMPAYRHRMAEFIIDEKIKTATAGQRSFLHALLCWLVAV